MTAIRHRGIYSCYNVFYMPHIRYSVDVDMFSCCKAKDPETKIVLLGLDRSGKTSLLKCIAGEDINKVVPTCGFNIRNYEMNKVILNIWDIGGMYME